MKLALIMEDSDNRLMPVEVRNTFYLLNQLNGQFYRPQFKLLRAYPSLHRHTTFIIVGKNKIVEFGQVRNA